MKKLPPKEVYIALKKERDGETWLHAADGYDEVAEESSVSMVGRYKLIEVLEISTLARPIARKPVKMSVPR